MQMVGTVLGIVCTAVFFIVFTVLAFAPYLLGMMDHEDRRKR
jgi:hypothetical protein